MPHRKAPLSACVNIQMCFRILSHSRLHGCFQFSVRTVPSKSATVIVGPFGTGLLIICLIILYLQRRQQHLQSQRNLWIPAPIRTTSTTATTPSPSLIWTWRWPSTVCPSPPPTDIRVNSKRHCSNVILIKYINKNRSLRHLLFDYKKNMHV